MKANDHQVGGNHYKTSMEHWDLVSLLKLDYFIGCSTAYVVRWRKKGDGYQDLKKALHFLNKRIELGGGNDELKFLTAVSLSLEEIGKTVTEFSAANNLTDLERAYILALCTWTEISELEAARELLFLLMDEAEALIDAKPVPLEDSNKHAERAT